VTRSSEGKSVRRFKENLAMNSFWDVSWWDVFLYGVVPPIVLVVAVGLWKLGRASVRLCDAGQLTWPQPGYFVPIGPTPTTVGRGVTGSGHSAKYALPKLRHISRTSDRSTQLLVDRLPTGASRRGSRDASKDHES
jgi:hypothetical protein